jgi:hypothetical protein
LFCINQSNKFADTKYQNHITVTKIKMNAISDFVEVNNHLIQYRLPQGFDAKRVQLIILPAENEPKTSTKVNRLKSLRGTITGTEAKNFSNHIETIRKEW